MTQPGIIIIGAGHAGLNAAASLRIEKYTGPIVLLGEEPDAPYHRPPLSKTFIKDEIDPARLLLRPLKFYADQNIQLRLGTRVNAIQPDQQTITLDSGEVLAYDQLILATGTRARPLPVEGIDLKGVDVMRTQDDARRIKAHLASVQQVVVIGGGFIGLEFAAAAASMDKHVTVLEAGTRLLARSVAPLTSEHVLGVHQQAGIHIVFNTQASALAGKDGQVTGVDCQDGQHYPAELVIVGVGALPNTGLAEAAGLKCDQGIVVDAQLRTSDPAIFAIGDCAAHINPYAEGRRVRLESVQNANDQARTVAQVVSGQREAVYHAVPWFWSDQGSMKIQMTGLSYNATDYVLRGQLEEGKFSVFHYAGTRLVAVDTVNMPMEHMACRQLLASGISPDPARVQDSSVNIKSLAG